MKLKTAELDGLLLDATVALAIGIKLLAAGSCYQHPAVGWRYKPNGQPYPWSPSMLWVDGGPIIERERISIRASSRSPCVWHACASAIMEGEGRSCGPLVRGPTPLIAAMRAYITSKLGDEVEIS